MHLITVISVHLLCCEKQEDLCLYMTPALSGKMWNNIYSKLQLWFLCTKTAPCATESYLGWACMSHNIFERTYREREFKQSQVKRKSYPPKSMFLSAILRFPSPGPHFYDLYWKYITSDKINANIIMGLSQYNAVIVSF